MSFNYLTNSSGFTRIAAYVGQLVDSAWIRGSRQFLKAFVRIRLADT
jgi:hypothetical protein